MCPALVVTNDRHHHRLIVPCLAKKGLCPMHDQPSKSKASKTTLLPLGEAARRAGLPSKDVLKRWMQMGKLPHTYRPRDGTKMTTVEAIERTITYLAAEARGENPEPIRLDLTPPPPTKHRETKDGSSQREIVRDIVRDDDGNEWVEDDTEGIDPFYGMGDQEVRFQIEDQVRDKIIGGDYDQSDDPYAGLVDVDNPGDSIEIGERRSFRLYGNLLTYDHPSTGEAVMSLVDEVYNSEIDPGIYIKSKRNLSPDEELAWTLASLKPLVPEASEGFLNRHHYPALEDEWLHGRKTLGERHDILRDLIGFVGKNPACEGKVYQDLTHKKYRDEWELFPDLYPLIYLVRYEGRTVQSVADETGLDARLVRQYIMDTRTIRKDPALIPVLQDWLPRRDEIFPERKPKVDGRKARGEAKRQAILQAVKDLYAQAGAPVAPGQVRKAAGITSPDTFYRQLNYLKDDALVTATPDGRLSPADLDSEADMDELMAS